ncbi:hypothetical protein ACOJIV_26440, partial [Haloarcula sp. AONF1]
GGSYGGSRGKGAVADAADRGRHRIHGGTCRSCAHSERNHVEPGETRFVGHDEQNAAHVVEYVRKE